MGTDRACPHSHTLPPAIATTSALLLALLAPLALADEAIRVVTWNLETVGTPGSAPYQAVAAVLGRIRPSPRVPLRRIRQPAGGMALFH